MDWSSGERPAAGAPRGEEALRRLIRLARHEARHANPGPPVEPLSDGALEEPITSDAAMTAAGEADTSAAPGDTLPRINGYLVTGLVSHGGQAVVYRGVSEATGRPVALKVLHG